MKTFKFQEIVRNYKSRIFPQQRKTYEFNTQTLVACTLRKLYLYVYLMTISVRCLFRIYSFVCFSRASKKLFQLFQRVRYISTT